MVGKIQRSIAARRMRSQRLWGPACSSPKQVLSVLGAMQAQEHAIARWSVAQRTRTQNAAAVDRALRDGIILRTHIIRPTWHFVLASDLRWLLAVSAPKVHALNAYYYRKCGVDAELAVRSQHVLARALEGGAQLTRVELAQALDRAGVEASGIRLAYVLMRAELDGVIVSGAVRGKQQTYAAFDARVPQGRGLDREEALAELTRRFFLARGPATLRDYARWGSLTLREARRGLELVRANLAHEEIEGRSYWFGPNACAARVESPVIDLVQGYDECIMSYSESRDVLLGKGAQTGLADASFLHAIFLDGQLAGHFRIVPEKRALCLETRLYRPLERSENRALDAAVERYGRFAGVAVTRL
jgi:hypothetical protein